MYRGRSAPGGTGGRSARSSACEMSRYANWWCQGMTFRTMYSLRCLVPFYVLLLPLLRSDQLKQTNSRHTHTTRICVQVDLRCLVRLLHVLPATASPAVHTSTHAPACRSISGALYASWNLASSACRSWTLSLKAAARGGRGLSEGKRVRRDQVSL